MKKRKGQARSRFIPHCSLTLRKGNIYNPTFICAQN